MFISLSKNSYDSLHQVLDFLNFSGETCTVTGNDWITCDLEAYERPPKEFPDGIRLPCLSFVVLRSLA